LYNIVTTGFRYLDHMTDAIVEAYGCSLDEAFENSAKGLVNTMIDLKQISPDQEYEIVAKGYDAKSLLYDWLEKVMLGLLIDNIALSDFKVKISERNSNYYLKGIAKGEILDLKKHHYKVEIKAVTYHEMEIKQTENIITTRFLLDL
jgi:SHS2 domain-containing protein